ncbi:MAG TPA: DUF1761 domain-containing protein [Gemmatimonadales bacterium]
MSINWLAVVAAAAASFVLGGLWYSPALFGPAWRIETGLTEAQLAAGSPAVTFGVSFVLSLLASAVFAMFLGPDPALGFALGAGSSAGFCWVAASFGVNYLFEKKSLRLWVINGGYHTVQFTLFGLILGVWH